MIRSLLTKPVTWFVVALLGLGSAGALYWFQPWRLFTDTTVNDSLAVVASTTAPAPAAASAAAPASSPRQEAPVAAVVAEGSFVTHEHDTSGSARIVRNADGSHQLELVDLNTDDGPDLRVWLTDQKVRTGIAGWRVFDDGEHLELGRLKGNHGDQVYAIPAGTDPGTFSSVSVWCKRFAVSFGAAPLTAAQPG